MSTHSCNDLGVCQQRTPRCPGCMPQPFAPGTIERHRARRTVWRRVRLVLLVAAGVTGLAFSAGYLWGTWAGA